MNKEDFIFEALKIIIRMFAKDTKTEAKTRLDSIVLLKKLEKKDED